MAQTIFILGTDPQQCNELREILQRRIPNQIVTSQVTELPPVAHSDTVIITSEEINTGALYRRLLTRVEEQVHRAELLAELIRLFSSSLQIEELLERVVTKSTEVLGDTSFIVLSNDAGELKLEAAYSTDRDRLVKLLIVTANLGNRALDLDLLSEVLVRRKPVIVPSLAQMNLPADIRTVVEKHSIMSLLAVPIQTKDAVLGAFVSLSQTKSFSTDDLATASALADFTSIALENAGLFAELQRSAITDSLTNVYNTRFFHEVLARETARAERYTTALSLLMIDVDTFKLINDTFGHVVGNKVLTNIAKELNQCVRTTDFVFRCGGDEFGIVLPGTDVEGAMRVSEKILQRVASSEVLTSLGHSGRVTVSIGVSEHRRGGNFETLVAEADQALYMCKRTSKNCAKAFRE